MRCWYIRWHLDGHSHIMSEQDFQDQNWKNASPATYDLVCRSISTADQDVKNCDWGAVISRVECAHTTCMTLAGESKEKEVYTRLARGRLARLMLLCIEKAPLELESQIPNSFWWAQHPEEKLLWYRFPWTAVDPLCECGDYCGQSKPVAGHWCGICAHEDPAKYTVGGLYAIGASQ